MPEQRKKSLAEPFRGTGQSAKGRDEEKEESSEEEEEKTIKRIDQRRSPSRRTSSSSSSSEESSSASMITQERNFDKRSPGLVSPQVVTKMCRGRGREKPRRSERPPLEPRKVLAYLSHPRGASSGAIGDPQPSEIAHSTRSPFHPPPPPPAGQRGTHSGPYTEPTLYTVPSHTSQGGTEQLIFSVQGCIIDAEILSYRFCIVDFIHHQFQSGVLCIMQLAMLWIRLHCRIAEPT